MHPAARTEALRLVRERARALGFDRVGVARADEPLGIEHARYLEFVAAGKHGQMKWLGDDPEARRRLDSSAILPGAKSVVCVARRYDRAPQREAADPPLARAMARYARGQDYHVFLRKKLRRLASFIRSLGEGVLARPICDVEPVLERAWAARAGIGFVGKNGLVIAPGQGSFVLLGEVVTTLELPVGTPIAERCGSCTRCLDACPTRAFDAPFVLDPRRCVSYWTIEARGAPPEPLRGLIGEHLFGCDVCQDVCPFNAGDHGPAAADPRPFEPHARWAKLSLETLVLLDEAAFREVAEGSPLHRAGKDGLARNAVLLADARLERDPADEGATRAIAAGLDHSDPAVREVSVWAERRRLRRLEGGAVEE